MMTAPVTALPLDSDRAILGVLEVTLKATIQTIEHLHPVLTDEPPPSVAALPSDDDRLADVLISTAYALIATLQAYRAAIDDDSIF